MGLLSEFVRFSLVAAFLSLPFRFVIELVRGCWLEAIEETPGPPKRDGCEFDGLDEDDPWSC